MSTPSGTTSPSLPPVVDHATWQAALDELRVREKAATRELDAIAAQRRRLPMVELPDYTLIGPDGPIRLVDVFAGRSQLIAGMANAAMSTVIETTFFISLSVLTEPAGRNGSSPRSPVTREVSALHCPCFRPEA